MAAKRKVKRRFRRAPWVPKLGDYVTVTAVPYQGNLPKEERTTHHVGQTFYLGDDDYPPRRLTGDDHEQAGWPATGESAWDYVLVAPVGLNYLFSARVRRATAAEEAACRLKA